jgi:hypothetical protein
MNNKILTFLNRADGFGKRYRWLLLAIAVADGVILVLLSHVKEIQIFTR